MNKTEKKWEEYFKNSELGKRIKTVEIFAIQHGYPEYHGQTIPELLCQVESEARTQALREAVEAISNKYIPEGTYTEKIWIDGFNYSKDLSIKSIKELTKEK